MRRGELERFPTWTVGASGEGHGACVEQESVGLLSKPGSTAGGFTVAVSVAVRLCEKWGGSNPAVPV